MRMDESVERELNLEEWNGSDGSALARQAGKQGEWQPWVENI